jgi:serine/threonine protein kinase|tara:strand:+ start:303 stop:443 length:141 start_codon:yes stop_codon:yes gene_type:complete
MSPERLLGEEYSFESDVWSMGVTILEALHGRLPHPNASSFMFMSHR